MAASTSTAPTLAERGLGHSAEPPIFLLRSATDLRIGPMPMPAGTVLITGSSTGIGEATAIHLKGLGFDVHAGVRQDDDGGRLSDPALTPVNQDVPDPVWIASARAEVEEASAGRL